MQFMGEYGSPNFTGDGNLCMVFRMTAFEAVTGVRRAEPDYEKTSLVLFWGVNPLTSERYGSFSSYNGMRQIIPRLKKRGISIITEDLYDHSFVRDYTKDFDALVAHVESCSPKWAEPLTGIPEKTIRNLSRTYATTKPALIYEGNGLDMYTNGVDSSRKVAMLIALTGNLDKKGGNVLMPYIPQSVLPNKPFPKEKRIDFQKFPLFVEVPFPSIKDALLSEEKDRPRAMIVHHSNPVLTQANEKRTRLAMANINVLVNDAFVAPVSGGTLNRLLACEVKKY
jgi:anaerobic selenocysteine-containing dehydrogenase